MHAKVIVGKNDYGFKCKKDFVYYQHDLITHVR